MIHRLDRRALLVLLALGGGALSACMTMARVHPELEARRSRIARVAVLPPETKFTLVTFKGDNPRMSTEEENAKAALPGMIAAKLREHGLVVDEGGVASSSDLRFQATEPQATFAQALGDLFTGPAGTKPTQVSRSPALRRPGLPIHSGWMPSRSCGSRGTRNRAARSPRTTQRASPAPS